jgi:hypothetical protein
MENKYGDSTFGPLRHNAIVAALVSTTNVRNRTNTSVGKEPLSNFVTLWAL